MRKKVISGLFAFGVISMAIASVASAANINFDGGPSGTGTDYLTAENWAGDVVPTTDDGSIITNDKAAILSGTTTDKRTMLADSGGSGELTLASGANYTATGYTATYNASEVGRNGNSGILTMQSGSVALFQSGLFLGHSSVGSTARVNYYTGAAMTLGGGTVGTDRGFAIRSNANATDDVVLALYINSGVLTPIETTVLALTNSGATKSLSLEVNLSGSAVTGGQVIEIISYSGTITGTFDGLAEGAVFTSGAAEFQISYVADSTAVSGNKAVTLHVVRAGVMLIYPLTGDSPTDPNLMWTAPDEYTPAYYHVYLDPNETRVAAATKGIEPNSSNPLLLNAQVTEPNYYSLTGLAYEETYYWKVEARRNYPGKDPNYFSSSVGTFTTLSEKPNITLEPVSQTVPATTNVTFTVAADNADNYHWKKYVEGGEDPNVGTGAELNLLDVESSDEGYYYCRVSNAADPPPSGINSEKARLMIQRLVAQWDFEDEIDASVGGFTGTYFDPNEVGTAVAVYDDSTPSPASGKALLLTGATLGSMGEGVIVSDPNYFNFYPLGVTASAWVTQVDEGNGWRCIASKEQRIDTPWIGWVLNASGGPYANLSIRQATGAGSNEINLTEENEDLGNNWHLVTGTYDGETVSIYVDGDLKNTATSSVVPDPILGEPLRIGIETFEGASPWKGLIDKVQIYNYALSRMEVAVLYTNLVSGVDICVEDMVDDDFDFNDDCVVNLKDFAEFAEAWLECYLVPACY